MTIKINRAAMAALMLTSSGLAVSSANADGSLKDTPAESTIVWTGIDKASGAFAGIAGFTTALNGDLSASGFLLRGDGLYVHTDQGQIWEGSPLLGYQIVDSLFTFSTFIGVDFHKLPNSDSTNVQGYETGFKVAASVETDEKERLVANIYGEYSTAFDSYWVRSRSGYNFKSFVIGPEAILVGNQSFRAERSGAFVLVPLEEYLGRPIDLTVSGGYQWVKGFDSQNIGNSAPISTVGQTGGYFSVAVSFIF
jgi:hypothetical protein